MKKLLEQGEKNRRVASTKANVESSRSHAVFTLEFRQVTNKKSLLLDSSQMGSSVGLPLSTLYIHFHTCSPF